MWRLSRGSGPTVWVPGSRGTAPEDRHASNDGARENDHPRRDRCRGGELEVAPTDIERDYLFGWILSTIFAGPLASELVLKGGNALRKGYFPNTRYSGDLDFATRDYVAEDALRTELQRTIELVGAETGVVFDNDRTRVEPKTRVHKDLEVLEGRVYFRDFYGKASRMVISIRMDFTQFERLLFDPVERRIIHPYGDAERCNGTIRCVRLEEILASKLKCLLQRRHVADLYDYLHWLFFGAEEVDARAVLSAFMSKTIYGREPGAAFELLVGLPFQVLRDAWSKYVVAPAKSLVGFEDALPKFVDHLRQLFGVSGQTSENRWWRPTVFFPSRLRNVILEAGYRQTLIRATYSGYERLLEPCSLRYKQRKESGALEYFYAYDQTGGRTGETGIKSLVADKFESAEVTDTSFEPRYEIEVSKAGDRSQAGTFTRKTYVPGFGIRRKSASRGPTYVFRCTMCGRVFAHQSFDGKLRAHKNARGSSCFGSFGSYVKTRW